MPNKFRIKASTTRRIWPSVYFDVQVIEPGDERGVGKVVTLLTKGWLPYKIRWSFRVTEKEPPTRIALIAWGDRLPLTTPTLALTLSKV